MALRLVVLSLLCFGSIVARLHAPQFEPVLVHAGFTESYWLESVDIDNDGRPDVVSSGLYSGELYWYKNPIGTEGSWICQNIALVDQPVAMEHTDINNDGFTDLIITYNYEGDGKIAWLQNPGPVYTSNWTLHDIGQVRTAHRLKLGNFTGSSRIQLMVLPISAYNNSAVDVLLFSPLEDVYQKWSYMLVDNTLHNVHGFWAVRDTNSTLDQLIIASKEGLTKVWYESCCSWRKLHIANGEPENGSGDVAVGKARDTEFIATVEPFHGKTVAVYTKNTGPDEILWNRLVLDVFGGIGHHVITADFDDDGMDEFVVALIGPDPFQGLFYYHVIDAEQGLYTKTRISTPSASRIVVNDFDGDGRLDLGTIGYAVDNVFVANDSSLWLFMNRIPITQRFSDWGLSVPTCVVADDII